MTVRLLPFHASRQVSQAFVLQGATISCRSLCKTPRFPSNVPFASTAWSRPQGSTRFCKGIKHPPRRPSTGASALLHHQRLPQRKRRTAQGPAPARAARKNFITASVTLSDYSPRPGPPRGHGRNRPRRNPPRNSRLCPAATCTRNKKLLQPGAPFCRKARAGRERGQDDGRRGHECGETCGER